MSEYIMDLRKIVGHRPLIQCGASVIVEDIQNRILLQLRHDNHTWSYAGGSVEIGEEVEQTAKRELYEETGLVAEELQLLGIFSGEGMDYVYPNGDQVSCIDIVYVCNKYHGELKPQESEVDDLRFFSLEEIPDQIAPMNQKAIRAYLKTKEK